MIRSPSDQVILSLWNSKLRSQISQSRNTTPHCFKFLTHRIHEHNDMIIVLLGGLSCSHTRWKVLFWERHKYTYKMCLQGSGWHHVKRVFLSLHSISYTSKEERYFKNYTLPHFLNLLLVAWSDQIIWWLQSVTPKGCIRTINLRIYLTFNMVTPSVILMKMHPVQRHKYIPSRDIPDSLQDQTLSLKAGCTAWHGPCWRGGLSSDIVQLPHGLFSLPIFIQGDDCQTGHQDLFNAWCSHVTSRPKFVTWLEGDVMKHRLCVYIKLHMD